MKPTTHNLKKVEALLTAAGYKVRYEKGHFQSGYCIVEQTNIIVINRFLDTEGRLNSLIDMLRQIELPTEPLDDKQRKLLSQLQSDPTT